MDAKHRLRLYLEQRRELGESELVLDALPVEEVLRMLGAPKPSTAQSRAAAPASATPPRRADVAETSHSSALPTSYAPPSTPSLSQPIAEATAGPLSPMDRVADEADRERESPTSSTPNWRDALKSPASTNVSRSHEAVASGSATPDWLSSLAIPFGITARPAAIGPTTALVENLSDLQSIAGVISACRACPLGEMALNPVPGEGNANADFVCVGEAPGQSEDESGRPFVGAAGQLLTKILSAIQLKRDDVFICNVLKHRPPGNRNPMPDEVRACTPYLTRQLELLKPRVILALGTFAAQTLLNTDTSLGKLRGQVHRYQGIPLIVTYHPAALLRNESWKRPAWDDVKMARRILDASRASVGDTQ